MKRKVKRRYQFRPGGVVYIFVAVFIGLTAINSQTNLLFWMFGLMLGGLLVSGLVSGLMLWGLKIQRMLPDHGVVDEPLMIRYRLSNPKWLIPCFGLVIEELDVDDQPLRGRPLGWVLHLGARTTVQAEGIGWPTRRGPVSFTRIRVRTTFPFGIFRKSLIFQQPGRTLVYPQLYRVRRSLLADIQARELAGARQVATAGGGEEFFGLRQYREGDSLKYIDWKRSAHYRRLVVREMTRPSPPRLMILLDLRLPGEPPYDPMEHAISLAASLVCEAHLEGFQVGLTVVGARCPLFRPHHSRWHRECLLHALAQIQPAQERIPTQWPNAQQLPAGWLVVHAGPVDPSFGPAGARHLTSEASDQYRAEDAAAPGGSPQPLPPDRMDQLKRKTRVAWA